MAPKERQQPSAESALGTDFYYEASTPLAVQVHCTVSHVCAKLSVVCVVLILRFVIQIHTRDTRNDTLDEVWIHPEMLALLDGAVLSDAPLGGQEPPVVVVWSLDKKTSGSSSSATPDSDSLSAPK